MMHIHIQNYAQGDALVLNFDCDTKCIDLKINGGFQPFDVEWQRIINGIWVTQTNWPKTGLNGHDGSEDLCKIKALGITEFKVIVTDALCGTAEQTIKVQPCESVPCDGLSISVENYTNVSECGGWDDVIPPPTPYDNCDGSIMISVNGATGPYTVQWSNGATGTSIAGLCTGTYTVTVTQGNCSAIETFDICCCNSTSMQGPYAHCPITTVSLDGDITPPTSGIAADGAIDLIVNPEASNIKYKWAGPNAFKSGSQDIFGLKIGTYCVTVTTGCGLPNIACFTLVDCTTSQLMISYKQIGNTCLGYSEGSIEIGVTGYQGPTSNLKYKWSDNLNSVNLFNSSSVNKLDVGNYCVTVSDIYGCSTSECFTVGLNNLDSTVNDQCLKTYICNGKDVKKIMYSVVRKTTTIGCVEIIECSNGQILEINRGGYWLFDENCTVWAYCNNKSKVFVAQGYSTEVEDTRNCITKVYCNVLLNGILITKYIGYYDEATPCIIFTSWFGPNDCFEIGYTWYCAWTNSYVTETTYTEDCSLLNRLPKCPDYNDGDGLQKIENRILNNADIELSYILSIDSNKFMENRKLISDSIIFNNRSIAKEDDKNSKTHIFYEEFINYRIESLNNFQHSFTFYDISGRAITSGILTNGENYINVGNLNAGFYFMQILTENSNLRTHRFFKPIK